MKKFTTITFVLVLAFALLSACSSGGGGESNQTVEQWTVSFDLNGGKIDGAATLADVKVTKGSSLGNQYPASPGREGSWAFDGWFDESVEPYEEYDADTPITKDLTLKAKWTSTDTTKWVVSFNTDGGTPVADIQVPRGETMGDLYPEDPTKERHEFDGWYLASDAGFEGTKYEKNTPAITENTYLKAKWKSLEITITINETGKKSNDSVTVSPESGMVGDEVTISYNLNGDSHYNQLNFSGITSVVIEEVTTAGTGTIKYTIAGEDATDGVITINAIFTHSDKPIITMAFEDEGNETKTYGDAPFTKAIPELTGINYVSSDMTVATVDNNGTVTILKVGSTSITATKAEDTNTYTPAIYELTVEPLQLIMATPTVTTSKKYNGSPTAAVTVGAITNKVGSDAVTVTAEAMYASENIGTGITITVVYSIDGADAGNYIEPENYETTGAITKADGRTVTVPTEASKKYNSITVNAVSISSTPTYEQTVQYAISTTASPVPSTGWQDELTFKKLTASTPYYVFARSKENSYCDAGVAQVSVAITTDVLPIITKYNFIAGDDLITGYPKYADVSTTPPTNSFTAEITGSSANGGDFLGKSVLKIIKNYNGGQPKLIIPFNVGTGAGQNLSNFERIIIIARGVSGDVNNKALNINIGSTQIGTTGNNGFNLNTNNGNDPSVISIPFNVNVSSYTGIVEIGFWINSPNAQNYEISSIELVKSPFKYDFVAGDTITAGYPTYGNNNNPATSAAAGISAIITTSGASTVLLVTKTTNYSTPRFILPFNVGAANTYSKVVINLRLVSGDLNGGKTWTLRSGTSNTSFGSVSTNYNTPFSANPVTLTFNLTNFASLTGEQDIGLDINNTNPFAYEILDITLGN
jgi:hypothetical protein